MRDRYLTSNIKVLALNRHKMAFVSGPRQVGKTTLAKSLLQEYAPGAYHNWDEIEFRRIWVKSPRSLVEALGNTAASNSLLVFDEIHKAKGWKGTLKGLYDRSAQTTGFLVTGSARLNVFKKGSDSLMGRYLNFRLHPLSIGELTTQIAPSPEETLANLFDSKKKAPAGTLPLWENLRAYGGFPEPFYARSEKISRLWRRNRVEKLVREDLRDLSRLPELSQVEMLVALLPERAAGTLSIPSLREDLEVAYETVKRWLNYLAELYYFYEVKPFARAIPRALKKEGKLYLWDWSEVALPAARFENMIASHLLKACHFWTDTGEGSFELTYLRDKQKQEIDFLIIRDRKPWLAVEAKSSDTQWSPNFGAFQKHLGNIPCLQLVDTRGTRFTTSQLPYQNLTCTAADALRFFP